MRFEEIDDPPLRIFAPFEEVMPMGQLQDRCGHHQRDPIDHPQRLVELAGEEPGRLVGHLVIDPVNDQQPTQPEGRVVGVAPPVAPGEPPVGPLLRPQPLAVDVAELGVDPRRAIGQS